MRLTLDSRYAEFGVQRFVEDFIQWSPGGSHRRVSKDHLWNLSLAEAAGVTSLRYFASVARRVP